MQSLSRAPQYDVLPQGLGDVLVNLRSSRVPLREPTSDLTMAHQYDRVDAIHREGCCRWKAWDSGGPSTL